MSASYSTDRNLLFAILSWQSGIITESQLLDAINRWTIKKHRSLAEILCDSGALTSEQMQLLEPMVEAQIRLHQGSPEAALSSLSFVPDVAASLRRGIADREVQASLDRFGSTFLNKTQPKSASAALADVNGNSGSRYTPRHLHAEGGLGAVYSAIDLELNREVALKEIRPEFAGDDESRARFVLEAEITGGLEHPGIVPVYGLGHYPDGRPFYAMRFIRGKSLKDAINEFHGRNGSHALKPDPETSRSEVTIGAAESGPDFNSLAFRKLLGRFVDVCQAISYAHSRGVLHRDLKPGNIMLGKYGETLVVDWGLAKVQGRADASIQPGEQTLQPSSGSGVTPTVAGQAMGTPAYMPPEQATGQLDQLGPASDVYSLGATLYHLLTGQTAFRTGDVAQQLANVVTGTFPMPRSIQTGIPKSLQAMCLKAMALRPADRYPSPQDLSDEVERWLADDPVLAHREAIGERIVRFARKHRARAFSAVVAVMTTALIATLAAFFINRAREAAEVALQQETLARQGEFDQRQQAEKQAEEAQKKAYIANIRLANSSWNENLIRTSRQALNSCTPIDQSPDLRNWEWHYLENRNNHVLLSFDLGPYAGLDRARWTQFGIFGTAISPDGQLIAVTKGEVVHLLDGVFGQSLQILKPEPTTELPQSAKPVFQRVLFSPDGQFVYSAGGNSVFCWNSETGVQVREFTGLTNSGYGDLAHSADGQRIAVTAFDGAVHQWNPATGEELAAISSPNAGAMCVCYSTDGRLLACGYEDGSIRVWNSDDGTNVHTFGLRGKEFHRGRQLMIHAVVLHPDGKRLFAGLSDRTIEVWDLPSQLRVGKWEAHDDFVTCLKITKDGHLLVSGSTDQTLALFETENGREVRRIRGHEDRVTSLALSGDERRVVSVSLDGNVRVWDMDSDPACRTTNSSWPGGNLNYRIRSSRDGRYVALASQLYTVICDARTMGILFLVSCQHGRISFSDDGDRALIGGALWYVPGKSVLNRLYPAITNFQDATVIELSPDGSRVVAVEDGCVVCCDAMTGATLERSPEFEFPIREVLFDRTGETVFCCGNKILQWHLETGSLSVLCDAPEDATGFSLCDAKPLLAGFQPNGSILVWNRESGALIGQCEGHRQQVDDVAFSPDGTRMVSCSMDGMVKVWDTTTLEEVCTLSGHSAPVFGVCFSSDGKRIMSSGWDSSVRTWFGDSDPTEMRQLCKAAGTAAFASRWIDGRSFTAEERAAIIEGDPFLSPTEKELAFRSLGRPRAAPAPEGSVSVSGSDVFNYPGHALQNEAVAAYVSRDAEQLSRILDVADSTYDRDLVLQRKIRHLQTLLSPPVIRDPAEIPSTTTMARISDLKFEAELVGWAAPMRNQSLMEAGAPPFIEVNGEFFESGLWAHAPSVYSVKLNRSWQTLTTGYGLQNRRRGSVDFVIRGDGRELFRSGSFSSTRAGFVSVSVKDIDVLELVVEDGGNGATHDWAVWMDPQLHR